MVASGIRQSRWGTRLLLVGLLLLVLSPFGFVAARSFVRLDDPSPAIGRAQVITQGIAQLPGDQYVMRIVRRTAPALGDAKIGRRALGFALATAEPILITEVQGEDEYRDVARAAVGGALMLGAGAGILLVLVGASLGHDIGGTMIVLGLFLWTGLARLVRGEFLTLREREYVDAARVSGARDARIIFRHILPNAIGVVIVTTTLVMAAAILLETGLSFLGFGIRPPDVSLGLIISQNQTAFSTRPYLFIWPGVFIVAIALSVNFIGDGLRDAFDPRQRRFSPRKTKEQVAS